MDEQTAMRRVPTHDRASARRLDCQVATAFKADRKARTAEAGAASLGEGKAKEAWGKLQAWYKHAGDRPQKPSRQDLRAVTEEYRALYTKDHPPLGEVIPVLAGPCHVLDEIPNEEEIATAVRRLRAGEAPGPSGMKTDHLKSWLAMAEREEQPDRTTWVELVTLVQHVYVTGDFPTALPKGSGGYRGIGLLEVFWKFLTSIIYGKMKESITLHDSLHGCRAKRGTGTAIFEAKLFQ